MSDSPIVNLKARGELPVIARYTCTKCEAKNEASFTYHPPISMAAAPTVRQYDHNCPSCGQLHVLQVDFSEWLGRSQK